jgi:hypothetical protein
MVLVASLPISTGFVAGVLTASIKLRIQELNVLMVTLNAILILIRGYPISVGEVANWCPTSSSSCLGIGQFVNGLISGQKVWWRVAWSCCICHNLCRSHIRSDWRAHRFPVALVGYHPGFSYCIPKPSTRFLLGGVNFGLGVMCGLIRLGSYPAAGRKSE